MQRFFPPVIALWRLFGSALRGYGFEHLEHSRRLVRLGYGGSFEELEGEVVPIYRLLKGSIKVTNPGSFSNPADRARNKLLCQRLLFDEDPRMPWRDETELAQFRAEMANALAAG